MGPYASSNRQRVLLATDGSPASEWAHQWIVAARWHAPPAVDVLTIADSTVLQPAWLPAAPSGEVLDLAELLREESEAEAASIAETSAARLRGAGMDAVGITEYGVPAVRLMDRISATDPALVALGRRGRSDVDAMLLGSVTHEVARYSPTAALIARDPAGEGSLLPRRVLIVVDPLTRAEPAVAWLQRQGWLAGVGVVLMAMLGASPGLLPGVQGAARMISMACHDHAEQVIADLAGRLGDTAREVTTTVRPGHPLDACSAVARDTQADLVVLCRPPHLPGRYPLAEKLTRYLPASVLLVPSD